MSIFDEKPSREFRDRVLAAAAPELEKRRNRQLSWNRRLVLAGGFLTLVLGVVPALYLKFRNEGPNEEQLSAALDNEMLEDSEMFEDMDLIEDVAVLEDWDGNDI